MLRVKVHRGSSPEDIGREILNGSDMSHDRAVGNVVWTVILFGDGAANLWEGVIRELPYTHSPGERYSLSNNSEMG